MAKESKSTGKKPDFNVYAKGPGENAPNMKIGAAWSVSKGGISISLVAAPIDGKVVLFPVKENEE